jgi:hypothetical protein
VSEAAALSPDPRLAALAATAWTLDPPPPSEMKHIMRDEAGTLLDGLLVRLARGRGALEVAIGEGLDALAVGDRVLRLGYSGIGDYARERLGVAASTADKLARLSRALRERPLLRAAVRAGEVSARKAETVLPVARGEDEAAWVARARGETVRALAAAVKEATGRAEEDDEAWERVALGLSAAQRAKLDEALELAGEHLGAGSPRWQRLEAICSEFLGAHPDPEEEPPPRSAASALDGWLEGAKAWVEQEYRQWEFLERVEPFPAPDEEPADAKTDPFLLDEDLRRLAALRDRWDEVFGHVAMLLRMCGLWRDMQFASFGHYCVERLGMAERTVAQRISLERKLYDLPALRGALKAGRISYEKARLVARVADASSVEGWIERARRAPCLALRRELEAAGEAQMCARGALVLRVPATVAGLVEAAFRAARAQRWLTDGECVERIAAHFVETWTVKRRNTVQRRVMARDGGRCQVPGCSRAAAHAHHVLFRSLGGNDEATNLVGLCAAHHLHGVHLGWVRVHGRAPQGLTWQLGVRAARAPLDVYA